MDSIDNLRLRNEEIEGRMLNVGMWNVGHWTLDIGYWILDVGYWILDSRYMYTGHQCI